MLSLLPAASPLSPLSIHPHHAFKVIPSSPFNATMLLLQQQQQQAAAAQFRQSYPLLPSSVVVPIAPPPFPCSAYSPALPYSGADYAQQSLHWTPQKRLCLPREPEQSVTAITPAAVSGPKQEEGTKKAAVALLPSPPDVARPTALRRSQTLSDAVVTTVGAVSPAALTRLSTDGGDSASPAWRSVLWAHMRSLLTKAEGEVDGSSLSPAHRSLLDSIKSDRTPASPLLLSQRPTPDSPSSRLSDGSSLSSLSSSAGSLSSGVATDCSHSDNDDSGGDDDDSHVDDDSELDAEAAGGRSMQENQQQQQTTAGSSPFTQPRPALPSSVSAATPLMLSCGFSAGVVCCSAASVSSSSCSPRKRRISKACIACRRRKRKCDGRSPSCSSCQRLQQRCDYPVSKRRGPQIGMLQKRRAELRQRAATNSSSSRPADQLRAPHQHTLHTLPPPPSPLLFPYALSMQPMSAAVFSRPALTAQPWPVMPIQR